MEKFYRNEILYILIFVSFCPEQIKYINL